MAFLCPVRIKKHKRKGVPPRVAPPAGRITGSDSIDTLVRVGLEKQQQGPRARMVVLHDFIPCVDDELAVKRDQQVQVLYQENDWLYVLTTEGKEGFIPYTYCLPVERSVDDFVLPKSKKTFSQNVGNERQHKQKTNLTRTDSKSMPDIINHKQAENSVHLSGIEKTLPKDMQKKQVIGQGHQSRSRESSRSRDQSVGQMSNQDYIAGQRVSRDRSVGQRSSQDISTGRRSSRDHSVGQRSSRDHSVGHRSLQDQSMGQRSSRDHSVGQRSYRDHSVGHRSLQDQSMGQNSSREFSNDRLSSRDRSIDHSSSRDHSMDHGMINTSMSSRGRSTERLLNKSSSASDNISFGSGEPLLHKSAPTSPNWRFNRHTSSQAAVHDYYNVLPTMTVTQHAVIVKNPGQKTQASLYADRNQIQYEKEKQKQQKAMHQTQPPSETPHPQNQRVPSQNEHVNLAQVHNRQSSRSLGKSNGVYAPEPAERPHTVQAPSVFDQRTAQMTNNRSDVFYQPGDYNTLPAKMSQAKQNFQRANSVHIPSPATEQSHSARHQRQSSLPATTNSIPYGDEVKQYDEFTKHSYGQYIVLFNYSPHQENDIAAERGEFVTLLNKDDEDWYWIRKRNQQEGFVPKSFLCPAEGQQDESIPKHNHPAVHKNSSHSQATRAKPHFNNANAKPHPSNGPHGAKNPPNIASRPHSSHLVSPHHPSSGAHTSHPSNPHCAFNHSGIPSLHPNTTHQASHPSSTTTTPSPHRTSPFHPPPPPFRMDRATRLVCLYDYSAEAPDDLSVTRGQWLYADLDLQPDPEWLWVFSPQSQTTGYIPRTYAKPPNFGTLSNTINNDPFVSP